MEAFILRVRRDRAVSTVIAGLIMLTLILSALGTMVFVSQQYAQYQQIASQMSQYRSQQLSENLIINSPGLAMLSSAGSWGSGCVTTYNCYNITVSNLSSIGVQVVRIYINSTGPTGSGCNPTLCILGPSSSIASYAFSGGNQFLNPGELNHAIVLALPLAVVLPNPTPAVSQNTVMLVTARGDVFAFQWPFQLQIYGQSQSAFSSGIMKVAYQKISSSGYDSINEPGPVAAGSGGTVSASYCHNEPVANYPAPSYDAEKLSGISGVGDGDVLWFVDPWLTNAIYTSAINYETSASTQLYLYVNVINTGSSSYTINAGSIDLTWYGQNHLDGTLLGVYYKGTFSTSATIAPGTNYYAIFTVNELKLNLWPPPNGDPQSAMFWGSASLTNAGAGGTSESAEDSTFFSGSILVSGLWIRASC